jgi:hypothetical protein
LLRVHGEIDLAPADERVTFRERCVATAGPFEQALGLRVIPLADAWAHRRFVICVMDYAALSISTRLPLDSLRESARLAEEEKAKNSVG